MHNPATKFLRSGSVLSFVVALAIGFAAAPASAAPCAGFNDVDDSDTVFCPSVEWLKNRRITLGCTSTTLYCPNNNVTRLQMAAFMNRLGKALTPEQFQVELGPGAIDLDANVVVCQTADFLIKFFARRAFVDATFSGTAAADVNVGVDLVYSTDTGATWTAINTNPNRGSVAAGLWSGASDIGYQDLDPDPNPNIEKTTRWGVRISRGGIPGATDLTDSRCQVRALVYNRNPASSPF